jgi:hypothetical protein
LHPLYCYGFAEILFKAFRIVASLVIVGLVFLLVYGSVYAGAAGFAAGTP